MMNLNIFEGFVCRKCHRSKGLSETEMSNRLFTDVMHIPTHILESIPVIPRYSIVICSDCGCTQPHENNVYRKISKLNFSMIEEFEDMVHLQICIQSDLKGCIPNDVSEHITEKITENTNKLTELLQDQYNKTMHLYECYAEMDRMWRDYVEKFITENNSI